MKLLLSQFVKLIHCIINTLQYKTLDDFPCRVDTRLQHLPVLLAIMAQHPIYLSASWIVITYPHTQTGIILTDKLHDMSQTVMSAIGTGTFQSESSQR